MSKRFARPTDYRPRVRYYPFSAIRTVQVKAKAGSRRSRDLNERHAQITREQLARHFDEYLPWGRHQRALFITALSS